MNWHAFSAAHRRGLLVGGAVAISTVAFGAGAFAMNGASDDGNSEVTVENASSAQNVTTTVEETTTTVADTTTTAAPTTTLPPPTTTTEPPPPPPTSPPSTAKTYTFEAPGAGTMTVKLEGGVMTVAATQAVDGWTAETHTATGTEYVKVIFRQGNTVKYVKARLKNGEVTAENGEWTECDTTPAAGTATYELGGVGAITVTWNGSAFTLDAATPAAGWVVASQEAPGDYVRVYFSPAPAEPTALTDGGHDDHNWIKVKIQDCQIVSYNSDS